MKESARLEKILKKHKLTSFPSYFVKRKILKSKRKTFAKILKMERYDSVFVSAAVYFEYLLGRLGIRITPAGGARIFAAGSVFSLFVIISSSVLLFYNYSSILRIYIAKTEIQEYEKGYMLYADSGVRIIRDNKEISALKARDRLFTKDEIVTGDTGTMLFQLERKTLVRVVAKSISRVDIDLKTKAMQLDTGTVLCNVRDMYADEEFTVTTPNAKVSVAGTKFSVTYENERTTVAVINGAVQAVNLMSKDAVRIAEGKTAVIFTDQIVLKDIEKSEEMMLQRFGRLEYMDNIIGRSDKEMDELRENITALDSDAEEDKKEEKIVTLDDIKRKYGKLEDIQLYNGKRYTGAIISRGGKFTIVTVKGTIKIPAKKVKKVRIIK